MRIQRKNQLLKFGAVVIGSCVFASGLIAAEPARQSSRIQVTFQEPEKFTDVKEEWADESVRNDRHRDFVMRELKAYIEKTVTPYLQNDERLEIRFTDIDLAGDFEPWRGVNFDTIRVVKDLYPPRMDIQFRLISADGQMLREGTKQLQKLGYMMTNLMPTSDPLRYDKEMLRSWLRQEFKQPKRTS